MVLKDYDINPREYLGEDDDCEFYSPNTKDDIFLKDVIKLSHLKWWIINRFKLFSENWVHMVWNYKKCTSGEGEMVNKMNKMLHQLLIEEIMSKFVKK